MFNTACNRYSEISSDSFLAYYTPCQVVDIDVNDHSVVVCPFVNSFYSAQYL